MTQLHQCRPLFLAFWLVTPGLGHAAEPSIQPAQRRQALAQWYEKNLVQAYGQVGRRSDEADKAARAALANAVRLYTRDPKRNDREDKNLIYNIDTAFQVGSEDPLLLYLYVRHLWTVAPETPWGTRRLLMDQSARQLAQSKYPATWKCAALAHAGFQKGHEKNKASAQTRTEAMKQLDAALALLPEALQDKTLPCELLEGICNDLVVGYLNLNDETKEDFSERKECFDKVQAVLVRELGEGHPFVSYFKGVFFINYAWDARSNRFADQVSEARWKLFAERLTEAGTLLEKAWEQEPANPAPARRMLTVVMGTNRKELGSAQRKELCEKWFNRAMQADPNDYAACTAKATLLEPKWFGTDEELIAFGRECLKGENWEGRLPLIVVHVHVALSKYPRGERQTWANKPDPEWLKVAEYWADIESAYEGYLKRYPDAYADRTEYAKLAYAAGKWSIAHAQCEKLGDFPRWSAFDDRGEYKQMRQDAARKAKGNAPVTPVSMAGR